MRFYALRAKLKFSPSGLMYSGRISTWREAGWFPIYVITQATTIVGSVVSLLDPTYAKMLELDQSVLKKTLYSYFSVC